MPKVYLTEKQRREAALEKKNKRFVGLVAMHLAEKQLEKQELARRVGIHPNTLTRYLQKPDTFIGVARAMFAELGFTDEEIREVL